MRGGMPSPAYAAADGSVVLLATQTGASSRWLALLILAVTVALTGAATGYMASQLRATSAGQVVRRAVPQALHKPVSPTRPASASGDRPAAVVRRLMPITVAVDGRLRRVTTTAKTARQVLTQVGVSLRPADRVFPSAATALWSGARVRVVRIERKFTTTRIALPLPAVTRKDPTLPRGMVRTDQGRAGVKVQRFLSTFADGRLVSTTYLSQEVLRAGVASVTRVGTKVLVASRGQFVGKEYMNLLATAYSPYCCRGVDSATAIGLRAGYGVVAVDPRVIPLRSRLYIEGYGYAIAGDTGGAIKGLRIDLGMDTLRAAKQFGRRSVRVYILEKGKPRKRS